MITPFVQLFAKTPGCDQPTFFGMLPWYHYLPQNPGDGCSVIFTLTDPKTHQFTGAGFYLIGLAVVDELLILAGLVSIVFIIYGGFSYMTSQGDPQATASAQSTVQHALTGLIIAVIAISLVRFLGSTLT